MKITLLFFFLLMCGPADAQWKKIADFNTTNELGVCCYNEPISCVYFLDLPGPSRIGFVGTQSELWKTTDGGNSWRSVWDSAKSYGLYNPTEISFKDSITGWFSIFDGSGSIADTACFRTTDGGDTWAPIIISGAFVGSNAVYYRPGTNRLFLSITGYIMELSTDLGDSWTPVSSGETGGISFSSDSVGIAAGYSDTIHGIVRTTDGGLTWIPIVISAGCEQPIAIPNSPFCFETDVARMIIRRSDDYGKTWVVTKDFGPLQDSQYNQLTPYDNGVIRGDLSRLYIQTDSGMYISTDEGFTWISDGGPAFSVSGMYEHFYHGKGVTFAGSSNTGPGLSQGEGLWEEDTAAAGVAEEQEGIISCATSSPNPFSTGTIITFGLSQGAYVKINLFDILGHEVTSPGFEVLFQPGNHEVPLSLQGLPSGTYYARILTAFGSVATVKLVKEQ